MKHDELHHARARELYSMGRTRKRTRNGLSAIQRYNETNTIVLFDIMQLVVGCCC